MIDSTQPTQPVSSIATVTEMRTRTTTGESQTKDTSSESKSSVTVSALTKKIQNDDSRDVDYTRVAEMRAALAAGELTLDSEKIAQALVQDIFQFN